MSHSNTREENRLGLAGAGTGQIWWRRGISVLTALQADRDRNPNLTWKNLIPWTLTIVKKSGVMPPACVGKPRSQENGNLPGKGLTSPPLTNADIQTAGQAEAIL